MKEGGIAHVSIYTAGEAITICSNNAARIITCGVHAYTALLVCVTLVWEQIGTMYGIRLPTLLQQCVSQSRSRIS